MSTIRRLTGPALLCTALLALPAFALQDAETAPPAKRLTPPDAKEIQAEPTKPLDERIDDSKITEIAFPPLPEWVLLPLPPEFRIAPDAESAPVDAAHYEKAMNAIERGLAFLRQSQSPRGLWGEAETATPTDQPEKPSPVAIAISAMVVKSMAQAGASPDDPVIAKAVRAILASQNDDGSFEGGALTNYVTSITVSALSAMAQDSPALRTPIDKATAWLQQGQWDQSEGLKPRQDWFGGAGYGSHGRPDMSNTQYMLDALYDAGLSPDEPAFQKALAFISRAQNLKQTNSAAWAGNDGGFIYTPANNGESMSSEYIGEGRYGEHIPEGEFRSLRSYGSMTYAGFKSMLYAGLSPDDVRIRAAFDWIRRHYTFDENPGVGQQGLYYYYHTLARALRVGQQTTITTDTGEQHNWRHDLINAIVERQRDDGYWINEADRWMEGQPDLVTAYALLALEEAIKQK